MRQMLMMMTFAVLILAACQKEPKQPEMQGMDEGEAVETSSEKQESIRVTLQDQENITIGIATLTERQDGVAITVTADHLSPGLHGFHIHETGQCEAPTFESAGAHFNPHGKDHGLSGNHEGHAGDLKNLKVGADGTVKQTFINDLVTLEKGKENSLLKEGGTSLIIHKNKDDYRTQPSGNAGERLACGVIAENAME